jgi:Macrocin-O-methyltransferase (TylF)
MITSLAGVGKWRRMSRDQRRHVLRCRADELVSIVVHQWLGRWLNRANRHAYLSYVPDSIRIFDKQPAFTRTVRRWTHQSARYNAGDVPRLLFLLNNAQRVVADKVPGHFAELGVYKGHTAELLANAVAEDDERRLYLFDTFAGFDARDTNARPTKRFADTSLPAVQRRVGHPDSCLYFPGYFPSSAETLDPNLTFALVHLDCDLYNPTAAGLRFFYPRLSPGAIVIVHDYASGHWPGVTRAVDEFLADKPDSLVLIPDKSGSAVFRRPLT